MISAHLAAWAAQDTQLLLVTLAALVTIVVLISFLSIAPFLSILIGTFVAGIGAGLPLEDIAKAFSKGAGAGHRDGDRTRVMRSGWRGRAAVSRHP